MLGPWLAATALAWLLVGALLHVSARRAQTLAGYEACAALRQPVSAAPTDRPWRIAVLGDLQRGVVDVPRALTAHLAEEPADLVIATGDVAIRGEAPWHGLVQRAFDRAGLATPLRAVPGNHDLYPSRCRDDREGGPVYERLYGARSWGLEAGPALLVGLDTGAAWRADLEWPHAASWLAARPDRPWLLFTHRPPWDFDAAGAPAYVDLAALPDRWQARRPSLVVAGHLVGSVDVVRDGVRTIVNGDGGDVRGHGREPTWSLLRIEVAADGACSVRTVTLPRSRDAAVARDVLALRMARSRRRLPGALLAAPWRLLLAPFGRNVPVHRPPLRRDYPTRDEAAAWLATSRPFASLEVTS